MIDLILWIVCLKFNTPVEAVARTTGKHHTDIRQLFAVLANREGIPNEEIARSLNCDRNAISGLITGGTVKIRTGHHMSVMIDEIQEDIEEAQDMLKDYKRIKAAKRIKTF